MSVENSKYKPLDQSYTSSSLNRPPEKKSSLPSYLNRARHILRQEGGIEQIWLTRGNSKAYQAKDGSWVSQKSLIDIATRNVRILSQNMSKGKKEIDGEQLSKEFGDEPLSVDGQLTSLIALKMFLKEGGASDVQLEKLDAALTDALIQKAFMGLKENQVIGALYVTCDSEEKAREAYNEAGVGTSIFYRKQEDPTAVFLIIKEGSYARNSSIKRIPITFETNLKQEIQNFHLEKRDKAREKSIENQKDKIFEAKNNQELGEAINTIAPGEYRIKITHPENKEEAVIVDFYYRGRDSKNLIQHEVLRFEHGDKLEEILSRAYENAKKLESEFISSHGKKVISSKLKVRTMAEEKSKIFRKDYRIQFNANGSLEVFYRTNSGNLYEKTYASLAHFEREFANNKRELELRDQRWVGQFHSLESPFEIDVDGKIVKCEKLEDISIGKEDPIRIKFNSLEVGEIMIWKDPSSAKVCVLQKGKEDMGKNYPGPSSLYREIEPPVGDLKTEIQRLVKQG